MPRSSDARDRAIATTATLLCRQGYAATGLTEVLELSGAPKGSFYFHFPGGKEQLATEAIQSADGYVAHMIQTTLDQSESPEGAVRGLASLFAGWLERSGYVEGCPVTTVTLETRPGSGVLSEACAASFRHWGTSMRRYLESVGYSPERSSLLANLIMCSLEGAFILGRSQMSSKPFTDAADVLVELL
ncbi:MAG: TetR/AcrR family transcriptional regulator [Acidimicrobiales bacterium]